MPFSLALAVLALAGCGGWAEVIVNKCCEHGMVLNTKGKCVVGKRAEVWTPNAFNGSAVKVRYGNVPCNTAYAEQLVVIEELGREDFRLYDNGTIRVREDPLYAFPPSTFCLDLTEHKYKIHTALLCPCKIKPCMRKCCMDSKNINGSNWKCQTPPGGHTWNLSSVMAPDVRSIFTLHGFPKCGERKKYLLNPTSNQSTGFHILSGGQLKVSTYARYITADDYCVDQVWLAQGSEDLNAIICFPDPEVLHYKVYSVLFIFGSFFLLGTFLVHALLPELRNLHGKNLMSHTASLFVAYVALGTVAIEGPTMPPAICMAIGFVIQFTFLAAFFWLNVMCIDISWAFSGLRPPQGSATERDRKKFIYYSLYAWGSTAIISIVTIFMDFAPGIPNTMLKPNLGKNRCWFKEKMAILAYFYGPMAALLLINLILFAYTATKIVAVRRDTAVLNKGNSSRHEGTSRGDKQRLVLYVKLFVLMGLSWITEIISWAVGGHDYYWYATDIVNLLLAVFIFIIFVCKKKVLCLLQNRFPWLKFKFLNNQTRGSSPTQSTSLSPNSISMTNLNTATTINTKTS